MDSFRTAKVRYSLILITMTPIAHTHTHTHTHTNRRRDGSGPGGGWNQWGDESVLLCLLVSVCGMKGDECHLPHRHTHETRANETRLPPFSLVLPWNLNLRVDCCLFDFHMRSLVSSLPSLPGLHLAKKKKKKKKPTPPLVFSVFPCFLFPDPQKARQSHPGPLQRTNNQPNSTSKSH